MFISAQIIDRTQAAINLANVTHITQYESEYPEGGSVFHFVSGGLLQVSESMTQLRSLIDKRAQSNEQPFILQSV